jgi:septum formation protein
LQQLGIPFQSVPSGIPEDVRPGENPAEHVLRLCEAKARDVAQTFPRHWVIGADTIVALRGEILGKPRDEQEALRMLGVLQGAAHEVFTGICVVRLRDQGCAKEVVRSVVRFRSLTPGEIAWYVGTGEPFDKAGAYGIQGFASVFIQGIEGSYANVVGLPTTELVQMLRKIGAWDLFAVRPASAHLLSPYTGASPPARHGG